MKKNQVNQLSHDVGKREVCDVSAAYCEPPTVNVDWALSTQLAVHSRNVATFSFAYIVRQLIHLIFLQEYSFSHFLKTHDITISISCIMLSHQTTHLYLFNNKYQISSLIFMLILSLSLYFQAHQFIGEPKSLHHISYPWKGRGVLWWGVRNTSAWLQTLHG